MAEKDVVKMVTIENDKLFISATIKLGLENFSSIDINFGITKQIDPKADIQTIANETFYNTIMPKAEEYAKALMERINPTIKANAEAKAKAQAQAQSQAQSTKSQYSNYQKGYGNKGYYSKYNSYKKGGEAGE